MIYVDTSVVLAHLLAEDQSPPASFWQGNLISSRLIEYEMWTRLHAHKLTSSHGDLARELIGRLALVELTPVVLARALEPFAVAVRTLDALHLASIAFIQSCGQTVELATYDQRMLAAARTLAVKSVPL